MEGAGAHGRLHAVADLARPVAADQAGGVHGALCNKSWNKRKDLIVYSVVTNRKM
jgi:hypothetical protein